MDSLKAPSLTSLISGTDRGSSDSLLGSLNLDLDDVLQKIFKLLFFFLSIIPLFCELKQIDDDLSIPPNTELPSLDTVMNEIDSSDLDIDSINSNNILSDNKRTSYTPSSNDEKQQSGSILRHVIFQGVTAQISSASVCPKLLLIPLVCVTIVLYFLRNELKLDMRRLFVYLV